MLAILPLVKKDGLSELSREIFNKLKLSLNITFDEKDAVGRRYRRQDAIGTPFCITVDHQSKEDNCVTVRNRDSMQQDRIAIVELEKFLLKKVSFKPFLNK